MNRQDMAITSTLSSCVENMDTKQFPFKTVFSLAPLVEFWQGEATSANPARTILAKLIEKDLHPSLEHLTSLADPAELEKHKSLIDTLMLMAFPPATWETDFTAALTPFGKTPFYATPSFKRHFSMSHLFSGADLNIDERLMGYGKILNAYLHIARAFYGIDIEFDYPVVITTTDPETKLPRYFNLKINSRFVQIKPSGDLPVLTDEQREHLMRHLGDLQVWMELLPPEKFEFHGFTLLNAADVTNQEVLSAMKRDLIDKSSIVSRTSFEKLQEKIRTLLRKPELTLSLTAVEGDEVFWLNNGLPNAAANCDSEFFVEKMRYRFADFKGSIFARAVETGQAIVIEDLTRYAECTAIENKMMQSGQIRSLIVSPLYYQEELIGVLMISSPNPADINEINSMKLREVLPLFSMAVKRTTEEINNSVQAVIKEKFTVIHQSIDWRFRKAAVRFLQQQNQGLTAELEDITFRDVYPLYGVSDVRGSSTQRNFAIQEDLIEHLAMARECLLVACTYKPLPVLEELIFRIGQKIERLRSEGLNSGDETLMLDFLHREVEPHFGHLATFHPDVQKHIDAYLAAIDPHLGIFYKRRKAFEDSVMKINDAISTYIDNEEQKAQAMFPHYFEKHKSDGVDYSIYIGASLIEDGKFDMLYLKNLRLWQLIMMCGVVGHIEQLKPTLPVQLDTAHLILVQTSPLSIRFRIDEKTLDVDGAYNVRYEIMKKRIDKAEVKLTGERITQPGKIALIYSQPKEISEYRDAITYLQARGYLTETLEELELKDLHGVQGLKALRVTVNVSQANTNGIMQMVEKAIRAVA
ncbi:MAG: GAF domain-containing protein [Rhizobacter sp.]|nr:GAF domain-containing protein [Chlorobiales bacterium]